MDMTNEANIRFVNSVTYDFEKCFISDYDISVANLPSVKFLKRHLIYSKLTDLKTFPRLRSLLDERVRLNQTIIDVSFTYTVPPTQIAITWLTYVLRTKLKQR